MKAKRILDAAMIVLLPLLIAYSLIGETFHEVAGVMMFALFIAHHVLNRGWWKGLARGRTTPERIFRTAVNFLLLAFMILQPLSGILLSKHLFTFLPTTGFTALSRQVHLLLAYWGFVLLSIHTGTHFDAMLATFKKHRPRAAKVVTAVLELIALYGAYAFFKRQLPDYLFGRIAFAFFDFGEPVIFFAADYLSMIVLFAAVGYGFVMFLRKIHRRSKAVT